MIQFFRPVVILGVALLMLPLTHVRAQAPVNCTVSIIDESGDPVVGAAVLIQGTNTGEMADVNGVCYLSGVPSDATLLVSCLGYDDLTVPVSGRTAITVTLKLSSLMMDEVVVVGYGTMKKRDLSGSVAQVKGDIINEYSSISVATALQGRVSGVQVNQSSGQPGGSIQVRIRGANSIKGNNEPLWIINGFPGDINMINTSDIESVEILKDASATAIYGSRGANGVVIVTTRSAKQGEIRVEYNGSFGVQDIIKKMEMCDAWEYMDYLNRKADINGFPHVYTEEQIASNLYSTDWQDEVFRTGFINDHSVNISGGNGKLQSSTGISYFDQTGIIKNTGYQRISINTNVKYNISKWLSANANVIYSRSDRQQLSTGSVVEAALITSPLGTPHYDDGSWNDFMTQPAAGNNPVAMVNELQRDWYSNRVMANAGLTIKPIDALTFQFSVNVLNKDSRTDNYTPLTYSSNSTGTASISFGNSTDITSNNIVTFDKQFGKHHLNVMGGMTYESSVTKTTGTGNAIGFLSDVAGTFDLDAAETKGLPTSSMSDWRLLSFLGRLNYNYDDRYFLTVNFRADGSSRYSKGDKWGYFPSAAAAWRIKQERFLRDVKWISELKLRLGYGVTGSTAINPYSTLNTLGTQNITLGKNLYVAYCPADTFLSTLKWEQTSQFNAGIDLAFFEYRLKLTADVYYKYTTNLLNDVEMPRSSGYTTSLRNIGALSNRGFEIQIDGRLIDSEVKWDMGANFSLNRSRIESLSDDQDIFGSTITTNIVSGQLNLMRVGEPMYVFYGYVEDGYDETGMIKYKNIDDDPNITPEDRQIIGNPNPDFLLNFNTSVSWKGLSLSAFFQGSYGNDLYGASMIANAYRYGYNSNTLREVLYNYWTPENPDAKYPNLWQNINLKMSDRFVYDASYLRLKNLELAYDVPFKQKNAIKKLRLSVSAQNLWTLTKYPFWDPDVNSRGGGSSLNQGIDEVSYPSAKTVSVGCKIIF